VKGLLTLSAYYGGKASHAKHLLPILEAIPHTHYVEAFGGLAALLLNKRPVKVEVYNDVDGALVALMRVVRERPEELAYQVGLTPYARDEYKYCQQILKEGKADELEMARAAWSMLKMTFNSTLTSGGFSTGGMARTSSIAKEFHNTSSFYRVGARLKDVIIENTSWEQVFELHDKPGALLYLDPPYHPNTRTSRGYRFEWSRSRHLAFVEKIVGAKAAVVVSGYDHPDYYSLEDAGWVRTCYMANTMQGVSGRMQAQESVWLNEAAQVGQGAWGLFAQEGVRL